MKRFRKNSQRTGKSSRRQSANYESLEARRLLATTYQAAAIADPFADNAVTVRQMIDRASARNYVKDELVVAYRIDGPAVRANVELEKLDWTVLAGEQDATTIRNLMSVDRDGGSSVTLVHLDLGENSDIFEVMRKLDANPNVMWSAPNFIEDGDVREFTPNDPDYPNQYHHPLIQNDLAWDVTLGDASILIGVTDDGVELDHPDLAANIWQNFADPPNGIDDDGNGYVDDFNGWDFSSGNNDPNPNSASDNHGTHVAGIAAGDTDNGIGIAGTAGGATIVPLQFFGVGEWTAAVINETFTYATDVGVNIVNTSYNIDRWWGDPVFTAGLQYMYDNNVLHLNSAGNNNSLNTLRQQFDQTIIVASTDNGDVRSSFSNYGVGVDVAAPGDSILSTVTGNGYDTFSGTSMATPNAAGVAALIWSHNPDWTSEQVAAQLLGTADNIDAVNGGFEGWLGSGRVNSYRGVTETLAAPQIEYTTGIPTDGDFLDDTTINSFAISFDQVMDSELANNTSNYDLRSAGLDGVFGTTDDVVHTLSHEIYQFGTNEFEFNVDSGPLGYGHYQLTVSSTLTNPFGEALDGDGDGTGGDDYVHEFFLSPPYQGTADFNRSYYLVEDAVTITVEDVNAAAPITVTVTSDAGDSETLTLVDQGTGSFVGTIDAVEGSVNAGDGTLQVALGHELTVSYFDSDDGFGGTLTATDTAVISSIIEIESDDTPVDITDNTTITSVINVTDSGVVTDLDVQLDITHTYNADLDVFLISPTGTRIELFSTIGSSDDNFTGTFLDDEAADGIERGAAPYTGSFRPFGRLSDVDTEIITGAWTLEITDNFSGDQGTLNWWRLFIDAQSFDVGFVTTDSPAYNEGDSIEVTVHDANAVDPVTIDATSTSGDVESFVLTNDGNGIWTGLIPTAAGTATNDSIVQADAGNSITFSYQDADDGNGSSVTRSTDVDIRNVFNYPSSDVPLDIEADTTSTSEIVISDPGTVRDINVLLDITHSFAGVLDVFLIAPDGTRIELFQDIGLNNGNFTQTILDDEAPRPISTGTAPFTGSFQPAGRLGDLDGLPIAGTWLLEITEDAGTNQGTLNAWSLDIDVTTDDRAAPIVDLVTINGGDNQRSMVRELVVNFDEVVNADSSSFMVENLDSTVCYVPDVVTEIVDGKTVATLTFSGSDIISGSLPDGNYRLTILDTITDSAGNQLDGDGDGVAGGNATDEFFRFYGDGNGDRSINVFDLLGFRTAYGPSGGDNNPDFDFNGDNQVNIFDLLQFRNRFGTSI